VEHLDKIADGAEACCDFFLDQRPEIPQEMKSNFLKIMEGSISAFVPLKKAISSFFRESFDIEAIRERTKEVGIIESAVDKEEWDITRDIFNTELDCGHKLHLKLCLESMVEISDRAEDTADELEIIIIKGGL